MRPLRPEQGDTLIRYLMRTIGFTYAKKPMLGNEDDYRYLSKDPIHVTLGPTEDFMPCMVVMIQDGKGQTNAMVAVACEVDGVSWHCMRPMSGIGPISGISCDPRPLTVLNKALKDYMKAHF